MMGLRKNLILRRPQRGRLEGRTQFIQPKTETPPAGVAPCAGAALFRPTGSLFYPCPKSRTPPRIFGNIYRYASVRLLKAFARQRGVKPRNFANTGFCGKESLLCPCYAAPIITTGAPMSC